MSRIMVNFGYGQISPDSSGVEYKPFYVKGKEQTCQICVRILEKVKDMCQGYDPLSIVTSFHIEVAWVRIEHPKHLFTKEEIEKEMRNADDRISNKLVIDDDGYAHVVPAKELSELYAVVHETWQAGNNYVGKYSNLSTLNESYLDSLHCWYEHLFYKNYRFCDEKNYYYQEQELIEMIKDYYPHK